MHSKPTTALLRGYQLPFFRPGRTDADYLIMVRKINTSIWECEILLVLIHHFHGTTRVWAIALSRVMQVRANDCFIGGMENYRTQHGIHYVAYNWNTNNLSQLCRFSYLWAGISTHRNALHAHPGIWSVKGNTTQTIQSYPYYNIQCITDTAYIYIYMYTSASKIFIHWLHARFSSGKHPHISMPIIRLCLGAIFARMASSSSTDNRPLYVQFCLPPEIHQQVAIYTQAEPLGIHERFPFNTCSLNAASYV